MLLTEQEMISYCYLLKQPLLKTARKKRIYGFGFHKDETDDRKNLRESDILMPNNLHQLESEMIELRTVQSLTFRTENPTQRYNRKPNRTGHSRTGRTLGLLVHSLNLSQVCDVFAKPPKAILE